MSALVALIMKPLSDTILKVRKADKEKPFIALVDPEIDEKAGYYRL
jgi:hypothetical protein